MKIVLVVISIILFCVIFYAALPKELSIFRRFDLIIRTLLFYFLIGRIGGLLFQSDLISMQWGLSPLGIEQDQVVVFSKLPWLIIRFWDESWRFPGYILSILLSLALSWLVEFKNLKFNFKTINDVIIGIFYHFTIMLVIQGFVGVEIFEGEIAIFSLNYSLSQALINLIIILFTSVLIVVYRIKNTSPIFLFAIGSTSLLLAIVKQLFNPQFLEVDISFYQAGILIILSVAYFVYVAVRNSMGNIEVELQNPVSQRVQRPGRDTQEMNDLYKGKYSPTKKWN